MNTFVTYLIATTVSLGIFLGVYVVLLRREPLFRFNRFYLLSALLFSYIIPLISFLPSTFAPSFVKAVNKGIIGTITLSPVEISATASSNPSLWSLLLYIYIAGMLFFTSRLIWRGLSIYRLAKSGEKSDESDIRIRWSNSDIPPFSFFRTMYLPVNLKDKTHLNEIISHEQIHIQSFHSFDILLTQLMQIVFWFNPFIPMVESSLREIHEFEADKAVIHAGTDPVAYTRILFGQDKVAQAIVLGNNFNYSLIKRRLTMFYRKSTRFARLKAAAVLPLAVCTVMFYAIGCNQSAKNTEAVNSDSLSQINQKVQMVKDSAGNEIGTATVIGDAGTPPPPPPPSPPPPPPPATKKTNESPVFTVVDNMPQFPGGDEARHKYINNSIKYPAEAIEKGLQGTVYVSFIVGTDGRIGDAKVMRGIGKSCDEEALRVVKEMPNWKPGSQNGKTVRVLFNMPIYFKLS